MEKIFILNAIMFACFTNTKAMRAGKFIELNDTELLQMRIKGAPAAARCASAAEFFIVPNNNGLTILNPTGITVNVRNGIRATLELMLEQEVMVHFRELIRIAQNTEKTGLSVQTLSDFNNNSGQIFEAIIAQMLPRAIQLQSQIESEDNSNNNGLAKQFETLRCNLDELQKVFKQEVIRALPTDYMQIQQRIMRLLFSLEDIIKEVRAQK